MADYPDYARVDVWNISNWAARIGAQKIWFGVGTVGAGADWNFDIYTVPEGKVIFISDITMSGLAEGTYVLLIAGSAFLQFFLGGNQAFSHSYVTPVPATAGQKISGWIRNRSAASAEFCYAVVAYEYSAD